MQKSRLPGISRHLNFIGVEPRQKILAKVRRFGRLFPCPRAPLDAVQRADFNPLACRVARAVADYELAFDAEARRCGSFDYIRLAALADEIEAVALDLFLREGDALSPRTEIRIRRVHLTS
jgi:hypothetical protein